MSGNTTLHHRMPWVAAAALLLTLTLVACSGADPTPTRTPDGSSPKPEATRAPERYPIMEVVVVDGVVSHREIVDFDAFLAETDLPVFVDFWADWCPPCKAAAPFVETLAAEYAGRVRIVKVDVDVEQQLASAFGVSAIPQFNVVRDARIVGKQAGFAPSIEPELRRMIEEALA